jgi:hypothetical protein
MAASMAGHTMYTLTTGCLLMAGKVFMMQTGDLVLGAKIITTVAAMAV